MYGSTKTAPGKGHHFGGPGVGSKPVIGGDSKNPIPLPPVTVEAPKMDLQPTKVAESGNKATYQNQDKNSDFHGTPQEFRTDLPPSDTWTDEKGNIKPEIQAEIDKQNKISNEPSQIRSSAIEESNKPGPDGAVQADPYEQDKQDQKDDLDSDYRKI